MADKVMIIPAVTMAPTAAVAEAAQGMHAARVKRLPVVEETGRQMKIVNRADVLKVLTRLDQAIRSEIITG